MINTDFMAAASAAALSAGQAIIEGVKNQAPAASDSENVYSMGSGLFPCVFVGMYGTILSPGDYEAWADEGEEEFYYNLVDYTEWKKALTEAAQEYINENVIGCLKNYGLLKIEATGIWSPKYYNYRNDELLMDLTMQQGWQQIMAAKVAEWKDNTEVQEYIHTYWKSRSGYVNFMPESLNEILTETDRERQLAAYLTLAMVTEGVNMDAGDCMEALYYSLTEDFAGCRCINVLAEYIGDEEAEDLLRVWDDDDAWNSLYWSIADKQGFPWFVEESKRLHAKEGLNTFEANSEGKRLLFWAVQNGYTLQDLKDMAA